MRLLAMYALCLLLAAGSASAQTAGSLWADPAALPPQQTARVFGQRIAFYEAGTGPTLVLVHGFASQAAFDWGQVIPSLAQHYHVLALDQIGFGASDKPAIDYSIQTFVDFLGEFLRTRGVQHFTLAGESLGGWIAAAYTIQALGAENHGSYALPKPDRLILEDAAGHSSIRGPAYGTGLPGRGRRYRHRLLQQGRSSRRSLYARAGPGSSPPMTARRSACSSTIPGWHRRS